MMNVFPKKNTFYIIIWLTLILYSKTTNTNPVALNELKDMHNFEWDDNFNDMNLLQKLEDIKKICKMLDNDINILKTKNQDCKLKIEMNKIYIKILYSLISIFLFIIFVIILIKFYFQCRKKKRVTKFYNLKEKFDIESIEEIKRIIN